MEEANDKIHMVDLYKILSILKIKNSEFWFTDYNREYHPVLISTLLKIKDTNNIKNSTINNISNGINDDMKNKDNTSHYMLDSLTLNLLCFHDSDDCYLKRVDRKTTGCDDLSSISKQVNFRYYKKINGEISLHRSF